VEVAAEKNSTLVLPFPVELLRFLENAGGSAGAAVEAMSNAVASLTGGSQTEVEKGSEKVAIDGGEPSVEELTARAKAEAEALSAESPIASGTESLTDPQDDSTGTLAKPEVREVPALTEEEIAERAAELVGDEAAEPSPIPPPSDS
jgi:hypothetical protein